MQVKFTLKAGQLTEMLEISENMTDSEIQEKLRQWVLDSADFKFEYIMTNHS